MGNMMTSLLRRCAGQQRGWSTNNYFDRFPTSSGPFIVWVGGQKWSFHKWAGGRIAEFNIWHSAFFAEGKTMPASSPPWPVQDNGRKNWCSEKISAVEKLVQWKQICCSKKIGAMKKNRCSEKNQCSERNGAVKKKSVQWIKRFSNKIWLIWGSVFAQAKMKRHIFRSD